MAAIAASTEEWIIGFENRRKILVLIATWSDPLAGAIESRVGNVSSEDARVVNDHVEGLPSSLPARLFADVARFSVTRVSPGQGEGKVRRRCRLSVQAASAVPGAGEIVVAATTLARSISRSNVISMGV
ncbi:MAG: hypothetical protein BWY66_02070 [bacterium ADurb.Bin374]|nr:MAG: hypothetical protein BWY66_02070 [bacterium ADurb.Bin374]